MTFTNVFGGNTLYPSDVSYLSLSLTANKTVEWPLESSGTQSPAARIIDVTPSASGYSISMPDATLTGAGQTILFNNLSGAYSFFVKDYAGNTLATVAFGTQWQIYLAATSTAAGTWRVFRYGASTATVQPSALAGSGLITDGSTLSQALPVTSFSTSGLTLATSNRASTYVWIGAGAGTLNLPAAASVGNNYFVLVRNAGGGDLAIDPSGAETINGASLVTFRPGDSATLITDGTKWYTVGFGQDATFAFDFTTIAVTGGNYTLSGAELNRIAYKFTGALLSDATIIIPSTVQQYWITNATSGSFNLYVKTASGTATQVTQGAKGIYYCDGSLVIFASDPTALVTPIALTQGGTGATTASGARLNLGVTPFADPILTATTGASVRTTISAAVLGANGDITSLTGLTTPLSVAQGGTGAATAAAGRTSLSAAVLGANGDITSLTGLTTPLSVAQGGTGAATAAAARTSLSAAVLGANGDITSLTGLTTPLSVAQGGTGAATLASTQLLKGNGTSAVSSSVVYDDGTNVGIGGAPSAGWNLDVKATGGTTSLRILNSGTASTDNASLALRTFATGLAQTSISFGDFTSTALGAIIYTNSDNRMTFRTNTSVVGYMSGGAFLLTSGSGGLGYGASAGAAYTQVTSRTTSITGANTPCGTINLFSAIATTAWQSFTVNTSLVAATDVVHVTQKSGTELFQIFVTATSAGSFRITFASTVAGSVTDANVVFNFAIIKSVAA